MKYYEDIAKECWKRGLVCTLGAITLMPMTVWAAMNGSALWAVSSALAGVFCWFGASIYYEDSKEAIRRAGLRK